MPEFSHVVSPYPTVSIPWARMISERNGTR
jgi:hypothetical protein